MKKCLLFVQWNSAIATTLDRFIKCCYGKGCRYSGFPQAGNKKKGDSVQYHVFLLKWCT